MTAGAAITLFVPPHHRVADGDGRRRLARRAVALDVGVELGWLSDDGTVPLDPDRVPEIYLVELPLRGLRLANRVGPLIALHAAVAVNATEPLSRQVPAGCAVLTVRIDRAVLDERAAALTGQSPSTPVRFVTGAHRVERRSRRWLDEIVARAAHLERDRALAAEPWFLDESSWIVTGLLYAFPHSHSHLLPLASAATARFARRWSGPVSIGPLLTRRRHDLGLSQTRVAELLADVSGTASITRARVSDYEHERHIPDDWLGYLSIVLDLPIDELERAAQEARFRRQVH